MKLVIYLTAILLTACGGGGSSAPAPEPVQPAQSAPSIQVAAYGDSTQEAQGQPHAASRPGAYVYNRGVGGTNTHHLLTGTDGVNYAWATQMPRETAKVVVINHGINDRGYPLETYKANLRELVTVAQNAGKIVMLEMPNPAGETMTPLMDRISFDVPAFEARRQAMRDLSVSMGVYLCDQPRVPLEDGIHPTVEGYRVKADRLAACLNDVLR